MLTTGVAHTSLDDTMIMSQQHLPLLPQLKSAEPAGQLLPPAACPAAANRCHHNRSPAIPFARRPACWLHQLPDSACSAVSQRQACRLRRQASSWSRCHTESEVVLRALAVQVPRALQVAGMAGRQPSSVSAHWKCSRHLGRPMARCSSVLRPQAAPAAAATPWLAVRGTASPAGQLAAAMLQPPRRHTPVT